jgi:hypothetical protein
MILYFIKPKDIPMTKLTSVKATKKQLFFVIAVVSASLTFSKSVLAEAIQVKTEPLEQRNIEQPHLDVLQNIKSALSKLSNATREYESSIQAEQADYEQCTDNLCKGTRLGESAKANVTYAESLLEYAEAVRDIEANQMQYIIDTMEIKHDGYVSAFNDKRADFFESYDQVAPQIQALQLKTTEDVAKLSSDEYLAWSKFATQLDRSLDDLTMMMHEVDALNKTKDVYELSKKGWHEHANEYELRSVKLEAAAFKQTRRQEYLAIVDYHAISFQDLSTIATTLSNLPTSSSMPFIPSIEPINSTSGQGVEITPAKRDGINILFDSADRIEAIRNFKTN